MKSRKKAHFTLLEILVVFLILSMGLVLTGVKLKDAYQEQRFLSETNLLLNQLRMAQDLMLILDADVEVALAYDKKNERLTSSLSVEKPMKKGWVKLTERVHHFRNIRSFEFDNARDERLVLHFQAGKMSKGQLYLSSVSKDSNEKGLEEKIELPGYPAFIGKQKLEEVNLLAESQMLYPEVVYEKLQKKEK